MREDLLQRLKELPGSASLSFYDESALVDYIQADLSDGEELLLTLAEHSLSHARAILSKLQPLLGRYQYRDCERIIERCAEAQEAQGLDGLTRDELDARLALLSLLPPESPEAQRMKRILTRVLVRRDPESAIEQLESAQPQDDDYDFHRSLLRELFWYFHNTNWQLALRCLKDGQDARR